MIRSKKIVCVCLVAFALLVKVSFAATYTTSQSGPWNDPNTWGGGGTPTLLTDDVVISGGFKVTANTTVSVNSIVIGSVSDVGNELEGVAGTTVTSTSIDLIPGNSAGGNGNNFLDVRNGNFVVNGNITNSVTSTGNGRDTRITIRGGSLNVSGFVNLGTSRRRSDIVFTNNATGSINVVGDVTVGTFKPRTLTGSAPGTFVANALNLGTGQTIVCAHSGGGVNGGAFVIACPVVNTGNITVRVNGDSDASTTDLILSGGINNSARNLFVNSGGTGKLGFGTSTVSVRDLTITAGTLSPPTGGGVLEINRDFVNNATLESSSGNIRLVGAQSDVSGSSDIDFNNLEIASGSKVVLGKNVDVLGTLTMTSGTVDLNGNTLTLGASAVSTGTLSHASGHMYGGDFTRYIAASPIADGVDAGLFPMGSPGGAYNPLYLSTSVTPGTRGAVTLAYTPGDIGDPTSTVSVADGGSTIEVSHASSWNLSTSGVVGGTYGLSVGGNGFGTIDDVGDLRLMIGGGVTGSAGANGGSTAVPTVRRGGLSLADITSVINIGSVDEANSPLPVELVKFEVIEKGAVNTVSWKTASEINNDYFLVQRSTNGHDFIDLAKLEGGGSTTIESNYSFEDTDLNGSVNYYYRIKQVDFNGDFEMSDVIISNNKMNVGVNIRNTHRAIIVNVEGESNGLCVIYTSNGREVLSQNINSGETQLFTSDFNSGVYVVVVSCAGNKTVKKIYIR